MIMGAHAVINHALEQGVSLAKATDAVPPHPQVLVWDGWDAVFGDLVAPVRVSLVKADCAWCEGWVPATRTALGERMCEHHAYRFGRFVPGFP